MQSVDGISRQVANGAEPASALESSALVPVTPAALMRLGPDLNLEPEPEPEAERLSSAGLAGAAGAAGPPTGAAAGAHRAGLSGALIRSAERWLGAVTGPVVQLLTPALAVAQNLTGTVVSIRDGSTPGGGRYTCREIDSQVRLCEHKEGRQ